MGNTGKGFQEERWCLEWTQRNRRGFGTKQRPPSANLQVLGWGAQTLSRGYWRALESSTQERERIRFML